MGKTIAVLFVGVFAGAFGYELLKKTGVTGKIAREVSKGVQLAKDTLHREKTEAVVEAAE